MIGLLDQTCLCCSSVLESFLCYLCALDLSKDFDSVCHSQRFSALHGSGVNLSVIILLRYWYSYSCLRLKSTPATVIKGKRGLFQEFWQ